MNTAPFISAEQGLALPAMQYIRARLTDALALIREIQTLAPDYIADGGGWVELYSLSVLFDAQPTYLSVEWYDRRNPGTLYRCESLSPFLAYVLRRWW